jgi:chromosome segregation ATPase
MPIATADAVDSLQATLEPLEALHGEHSQLETWVHDSFSALEKLHSELTEWQSELARKQTELDLREDAISRTSARPATAESGEFSEQLALLQQELAECREEAQQLEEESAEQLQELENLELQLVQMEKELKSAQKRAKELTELLEVERARTAQEQHQWQGEMRDMRRLLEKQCSLLEDRIRDSREASETEGDQSAEAASSVETEGTSRTAELRRRAKSRWAAKLRKHREGEQPSKS